MVRHLVCVSSRCGPWFPIAPKNLAIYGVSRRVCRKRNAYLGPKRRIAEADFRSLNISSESSFTGDRSCGFGEDGSALRTAIGFMLMLEARAVEDLVPSQNSSVDFCL